MAYTVDDKFIIKRADVETIVREVCVSYAHLRRSFLTAYSYLNKQLDDGDLASAVCSLMETFALPSNFCTRVRYNAKGLSPAAVAAMEMDFTRNNHPLSGTLLFVESKTAVIQTPRYRLIHVIAHELAHARMFLDKHPRRTSEFGTDVLALMVTGDAKGLPEHMQTLTGFYGYIRPDLNQAVFRALRQHSEKIYLP